MNLIVAVDKNWAIGNKNKLLIQIPSDMKNFRMLTTGNVIIMGRKTLESFPQSQPLGNRVNIVLTRSENYKVNGATVVHSLDALWEEIKKYPDKEIYVLGGESIYRMMLPYCDTAYVTKIDYAYEADTWMPDLDREEGWSVVERGEEQTCFDLIYYFTTYKNESPKSFS